MILILVRAGEGGNGPFGSVKIGSFDSLNSVCVCSRTQLVELLCWVGTRRDRKNLWQIVIIKSWDLPRQDHKQIQNLIFLQVVTSQWPRRLRHRSAAACLLRLWVQIPRGAWMSVCCSVVCCQVEVSATSWSLVQRSPTDCGALLSVV